jgi:hypothetical protein
MPSLADLKLTSISWKQENKQLCGLQLTFKNGLQSPKFLSNDATPEFFTTEQIDPEVEIRKIRVKLGKFSIRTSGILGIEMLT